MRHAILLLALSVALTGSCLAQLAFEGTDEDALTFLAQLHNALEAQHADDYAALFDSSGSWDGPFGQNALGPVNIRTAARQFFTEFGPLTTVFKVARQLSPDIVMAEVYQRRNGRHTSLDPKLIARGSGTAPHDADVRTTLILARQESGWKIIAARVADLAQETARS